MTPRDVLARQHCGLNVKVCPSVCGGCLISAGEDLAALAAAGFPVRSDAEVAAQVAAAVLAERAACSATTQELRARVHELREINREMGRDVAAMLAQARREGIEAAAAWHDAEAAACGAHIAKMPDADPGDGCLSLVSQLRERARLHRADAISIRALLPKGSPDGGK